MACSRRNICLPADAAHQRRHPLASSTNAAYHFGYEYLTETINITSVGGFDTNRIRLSSAQSSTSLHQRLDPLSQILPLEKQCFDSFALPVGVCNAHRMAPCSMRFGPASDVWRGDFLFGPRQSFCLLFSWFRFWSRRRYLQLPNGIARYLRRSPF